MASTIYKGHLLRFKFQGKKFLHATSCKLDFATKLEEIATKDTNGTVSIPSSYSWSGSTEALLSNLAALDLTHVTYDTLLSAQMNQEEIDVVFTTDVTGDIIYTGKAYIESSSVDATDGNAVKVSISIKGNGDLMKALVV